LATELEKRGHDLDHPLWSARLLLKDPYEIRSVHRSYLEAGADCIISSSYQATIPGLISEGLSEKDAKDLIKKTVTIACDARDDFLSRTTDRKRIRPLVAASIGPYGAYLADGSEYKGDYFLTSKKLKDFHQPRLELLTQTSADLIACETIPTIREAEALKELLDDTPGVQAILSLISRIAQCKSSKKIIVYPNSGEQFDPNQKKWLDTQSTYDFSKLALKWYNAGARMIGGCCRTGPIGYACS
jgi:homocysteine S-methyltransferase